MKTTSRKIEFQNITTSRPINEISKLTLYVFFFLLFWNWTDKCLKTSRFHFRKENKDWCLNVNWLVEETVMFLILRPHWLVEEKRDGCEFCFCNIIALWKENTWCVLNVTTTFSLVKEKIWCFKWMQRHYFLDRRNVMFLITHLWFFFYFKNRHLW